jgi:hypothetical protein
MIKIVNVLVQGIEPALRGMRNPKKSWDKSDSFDCEKNWSCKDKDCPKYIVSGSVMCNRKEDDVSFIIGKRDHELAMKLVTAGSAHAKFRRMIGVWADITAPRYWWIEWDTYKVSTVSNSESTMHCIHQKPFELDDFSHEKMDEATVYCLNCLVKSLNVIREKYLENNDKDTWYQMIQLLPQSYNQKRTVYLNYEVLANMYRLRKNHKLDEWRTLCDWIKTLPYSEFIIGEENEKV